MSCAGPGDGIDDEMMGLPPGTGGSDAAGTVREGGTPSSDAGFDGPCDLAKPFGAPVPIAELNTSDQDIVADVSPDELTIFVVTNHAVPGVQLFYATRSAKTAAWGPLTLLFPSGNWANLAVAVNGTTAIVSSDRSGNSELYVATRPTPLAQFGPLTPTFGASSTGAEEGPRWGADGKTFYFDSTRDGSRDIFVSTLVNGKFSDVTPLKTINTPGVEGVPVLTADELSMYFVSDRAPAAGPGDIFVATRPSKTASFGSNVTLVPNVNSDGLDAPGHISADGCTLYLSSTRLGSFDIFAARRPN
jgi:hypothetical protein